jgi:hypothetical protein
MEQSKKEEISIAEGKAFGIFGFSLSKMEFLKLTMKSKN